MATGLSIITTAFKELGIVDGIDAPPAELSALGLELLNRIFDDWNAEHGASFAVLESTFAFTPSLNPHTIGPSGATWTVTTGRPVDIEAMSVSLGGSPAVFKTVYKRDQPWYEGRTVPDLTLDWPTDFFYNPTWPNGSVYLYPVPTTAAAVTVWSKILLTQVALATTVTLPMGYQGAITDTLKERLAGLPTFASMMTPDLTRAASVSRARIFGANEKPLRLATDSGLSTGDASVYDWRQGPALT